MPRSLFIPTIGDVLVLAEPWSFPLHEEHRNQKFADDNFQLGYRSVYGWYAGMVPPARFDTITLPVGTQLKVDRLYIRGTTENDRKFDSISFYCNVHLKSGSKLARTAIRGRFWAKLQDVNRIVFE